MHHDQFAMLQQWFVMKPLDVAQAVVVLATVEVVHQPKGKTTTMFPTSIVFDLHFLWHIGPPSTISTLGLKVSKGRSIQCIISALKTCHNSFINFSAKTPLFCFGYDIGKINEKGPLTVHAWPSFVKKQYCVQAAV
jgi:hypothetical protein